VILPWCAIASKENIIPIVLSGFTQKLPFFHENRTAASFHASNSPYQGSSCCKRSQSAAAQSNDYNFVLMWLQNIVSFSLAVPDG